MSVTESAPDLRWDFFISHACEDKETVARPLAHLLERLGCTVWYDEFELGVGDSLLAKISEGLSESRLGVVVMSPSFFAKRWPARELSGLFALETTDRNKILPVWHEVDVSDVARYSPILADRIGVTTFAGTDAVAKALIASAFRDAEFRTVVSGRLGGRVARYVEIDDPRGVREILRLQPKLAGSLAGFGGSADVATDDVPWLGTPHVVVRQFVQTTGLHDVVILVLLPVRSEIVTPDGRPAPEIRAVVDQIKDLRRRIAHGDRPPELDDVRSSHFTVTALVGLRETLDEHRAAQLHQLSAELIGVNLRTYDHLLDRASEILGGRS